MEEEEVEEVEGTTRGVWTIQRKSRALSSSCHPLWLPLLYLPRLLRPYWDALINKIFKNFLGGERSPNPNPIEMAKNGKIGIKFPKGEISLVQNHLPVSIVLH